MSDRAADAATGAVERSTAWIAWLFTIGSACFAVASIPMLADALPDEIVGVTYFVGSAFFTSAAATVLATTPRREAADWWAAAIQFVGTLWFNVNTFAALRDGFSTEQEILRVWTPDFVGSICFMVSSVVASWVARQVGPWAVRRHNKDWRVAAWNFVGSALFLVSAFAAFIRPDTGDALDASLANSGTLLGAVCFLVGAQIMLRPTVPAARLRG
jgi:hypothetical protein